MASWMLETLPSGRKQWLLEDSKYLAIVAEHGGEWAIFEASANGKFMDLAGVEYTTEAAKLAANKAISNLIIEDELSKKGNPSKAFREHTKSHFSAWLRSVKRIPHGSYLTKDLNGHEFDKLTTQEMKHVLKYMKIAYSLGFHDGRK